MKQNLITVCFSIKPVYSEKIMTGEKKYELRKRLPNGNMDFIVIYTTTPICKIVGYAKVKEVHVKTVNDMWEIVSSSAGICKKDYMAYFHGKDNAYAIELENIRRFKKPFNIKEINKNFSAPQSFCYVKEEDFIRLKKRCSEYV